MAKQDHSMQHSVFQDVLQCPLERGAVSVTLKNQACQPPQRGLHDASKLDSAGGLVTPRRLEAGPPCRRSEGDVGPVPRAAARRVTGGRSPVPPLGGVT